MYSKENDFDELEKFIEKVDGHFYRKTSFLEKRCEDLGKTIKEQL